MFDSQYQVDIWLHNMQEHKFMLKFQTTLSNDNLFQENAYKMHVQMLEVSLHTTSPTPPSIHPNPPMSISLKL